jgi:lysine biosynthesis protein LysW
MPKTYCPECDAVIGVQDPKIGYQFKCPECDVDLEVTSVDPFDVYFPYEDDENWDEDQGGSWDDN